MSVPARLWDANGEWAAAIAAAARTRTRMRMEVEVDIARHFGGAY
jgi:hypothetical protein